MTLKLSKTQNETIQGISQESRNLNAENFPHPRRLFLQQPTEYNNDRLTLIRKRRTYQQSGAAPYQAATSLEFSNQADSSQTFSEIKRQFMSTPSPSETSYSPFSTVMPTSLIHLQQPAESSRHATIIYSTVPKVSTLHTGADVDNNSNSAVMYALMPRLTNFQDILTTNVKEVNSRSASIQLRPTQTTAKCAAAEINVHKHQRTAKVPSLSVIPARRRRRNLQHENDRDTAAPRSAEVSHPSSTVTNSWSTSDDDFTSPARTYDHICKICKVYEIHSILLPCAHFCICQICFDSLNQIECPYCRSSVTDFKQVYF